MHGGVFKRLPYDVDTRTDLAAAAEGGVVVEAHAVVDREDRIDLPFVLQIDALDRLRVAAIVYDTSRYVCRLCSCIIDGQHLGNRVTGQMVHLGIYTRPDGMVVSQSVGAVALKPVRDVSFVGLL